MEAKAMEPAFLGSVFTVAGDGMPHLGGMHPDLVFPARVERKFHERESVAAFEDVEICDGEFPLIRIVGGVDHELGVLRQS